MVATGREPTLPPDLQNDAWASPSLDDPADYVEMLRQRLSMTHQQMTAPPIPASANPYQEGSLIFVMTTPPERTHKLTPRWKGPFRVKRVPNPYQVVYEDGSTWRTINVNHAKPAKLTAPDLPLPTPEPEPPRPALGYLPRSLQRPCSHPPPPPPQAAAPDGGASPPPASSIPTPPAASPPASERPTREIPSAKRNSASSPHLSSHPATEIQPPTSTPANQNSGSVFRPRRSARLNQGLDQACTIKGPPGTLAPQSQQFSKMARTYPLSLGFNQCLGAKEDPYSFSSVYLEDLRNGDLEYLSTIEQLVDALPKTMDPASRFALRGHVTPPGHQRLRHSMRAALWWLLPSDGEFCRASHALHYYLARQGRRVVLRGGDVTQPLYESRMNWINDPALPASRRPATEAAPTPASAILMPSPRAPSLLPRRQKSRRRRRRKAARPANQNAASRQADPATPDERSTQPRSTANDLPEMMSTPVEHPNSFTSSRLSQPPIPAANQNSGSSSCQDHSEFWGLYKLAQSDPRQDSTATLTRDNISGFGLSSPALQQPSTKPFSGPPARHMTGPHREAGEADRERPGIVYPLLPCAARPDTRLTIDAALPEAAALDRRSRPPKVLDIAGTSLPESHQSQGPRFARRQSRKRRPNRSTGFYRPSKRSPPRGHWCE